MSLNVLQEGEDFYYNDQKYKVFTENYHLKRGYCCKSGCKLCPYGYDKKTDSFRKVEKAEQDKAKEPKFTNR